MGEALVIERPRKISFEEYQGVNSKITSKAKRFIQE